MTITFSVDNQCNQPLPAINSSIIVRFNIFDLKSVQLFSLRKSIRKSALELLDDIGTAQMEQEVQKRILKIVKSNKEKLEAGTGVSCSVTEDDVKEYLEILKQELPKKT